MQRIFTLASCCIFFIYFTPINANEYNSLEPHEHGKIAINLAVIDTTLDIYLEGASAGITGFEYKPKTDSDKKVAQLAKFSLENPLALFAISPEAGCVITQKEVHSAIFDIKAVNDVINENNDGHHHSNIEAFYSLTCEQPYALKQLDFTNFFETFPLTKQINLQYVDDEVQDEVRLNKTNPIFKLNH